MYVTATMGNYFQGMCVWQIFSPVSVDSEIVLVYLSQLVRWSCEEWCSPRNWTKTRDNWMINSLFLTFQTYSTFSSDSSTANPSSTVQEDWRTRTKYSSREKLEKKIKVKNFRNMCFGGKCTYFSKIINYCLRQRTPKMIVFEVRNSFDIVREELIQQFFIIILHHLQLLPWHRSLVENVHHSLRYPPELLSQPCWWMNLLIVKCWNIIQIWRHFIKQGPAENIHIWSIKQNLCNILKYFYTSFWGMIVWWHFLSLNSLCCTKWWSLCWLWNSCCN